MSDRHIAPSVEAGVVQPDPAKSVFLNCPFDPAFEPLLQALIFAIICCDFHPRSALKSGTVAEPRLDRITRAIFTSRYSIHDLSRCRGEGDERLARFNMPLELGIALACRYFTRDQADQHDWTLLVPTGHVYVKVVSDLAGFDPLKYDGEVEQIIQCVMSWLITRPRVTLSGTTLSLTPRDVLTAFPAFQAELAQLKQNWGQEPPWFHILEVAKKHVPRP